MRKVILVDPHVSGHHLSYIKIYATAFAELGCEVAILSPEIQMLQSYLSGLIEEYGDKIKVFELSRRNISSFELGNQRKQGRINNLWKAFFSWLDFMDIARAIRTNHLDRNALVFILWLDTYITRYLPAFFVDAVMPARFSGLYFHPGHLKIEERSGKTYRDLLFYLPLLKSRKLKFVGGFDELLMHKLGNRYEGVEFVTLPDVAEKHAPAVDDVLIQTILQKARDRKIVSLVGSLDPRKNVLNFLLAAKEYGHDDTFFVCVGKLHAERFSSDDLKLIREISSDCSEKIFFYDDFIASDEVFDALLMISSAVFAVYVNFPSSSNMIVKASLFGVPIIVSSEHLMGELVDKYDLGLCIAKHDPKTIQDSIKQLISQDRQYGFKEFNSDHSFESLKDTLLRLI